MNRSLWSLTLRRWLFTRPTTVATNQLRRLTRGRLSLECLEDRLVPASTINVAAGDSQGLIAAINQADVTVGGATIVLAQNSTYTLTDVNNTLYGPNGLPAITNNVIIQGNGSTITRSSGAPDFRLFFISGGPSLSGTNNLPAGSLELDNVTLSGGVAQGGNSLSGGGGLGAGGAIFNMGTLTLNGDTLTNDQAIGGGSGAASAGSGGGGIGADSSGGNGGGFGGTFVSVGAPGGTGDASGNGGAGGGGGGFSTAGANASGTTGGAGGGQSGLAPGGGDGGVGASLPSASTLSGGNGGSFGQGGFGSGAGGGGGGVGGGGGSGTVGGAGGFGGGGGQGSSGATGGLGGFGGGGGNSATGGFGGGAGSATLGGGGAGMGGGLFNLYGSATLINTTISGDSASGGKGANGGSGFGGGIFNLDGSVSLTYTTVAANTVTGGVGVGGSNGTSDGAGIYNLAFGNSPSAGTALTTTLSLTNSIIGQNTGGNDLINDSQNGAATNTAAITGSTNLVQTENVNVGNGNKTIQPNVVTILGASPNLGALTNNGGLIPLPTMVLQAGSPALGVANTGITGLPVVDQRGLPRPSTAPDLGAAQTQVTALAVSPASSTFNSTTDQTVTLTATVTDNGVAMPQAAGTVTFTVGNLAPVTGSVNNAGLGMATLTLPAGFAAGSYTIKATFKDSAGVFSTSTANGTLTVNAAATSTAVTNVNAVFNSGAAQSVNLTATVTSSNGGVVNEGNVTFTVNGLTATGAVNASGVATASLSLPAGFAVGTDTLTATFADATNANSAVNFAGSTGNGTLTVFAAGTQTVAGSTTATFNSGTNSVTVVANVTSPNGTVNEGTVTFTLVNPNGANVTTSAAVSGGTASATLVLPPGFAAGSYDINASFGDNTTNFAPSNSSVPGTLTLNAATTTVSVNNAVGNFNSGAQQLVLTASVASTSGGTVNEGNVTFSVNGLPSVVATINNQGIATAILNLPPGLAAGTYTLNASYSDVFNANGLVNFSASSTATNPGTVTLSTADSSTAVSNINVTFSPNAQSATLRAVVTSTLGGVVNEGNVMFSVAGQNLAAAVVNGVATIGVNLPAGLATGGYSIIANYADLTNANNTTNFGGSGGTATLTVAPLATSVNITRVAVNSFFGSSITETVTAQVTSPGGTVDGGTVTFNFGGKTVQANVSNGTASATIAVSSSDVTGTESVGATFGGSGNFAGSSQFRNAILNFFSAFFPTVVSFNSDGSQQVVVSFGFIPLIFNYDPSGALVNVFFGFLPL
jgi:hypothetical protein